MKRVVVDRLRLWQFENLSSERGVKHFVTERNSASSEIPFTLSYSSSPDKALIRSNRAMVAEVMGIDESLFFMPSQIHKTRIVNVKHTTSKDDLAETDALITNERGLCIAVMSADCVPVLLFDKKNHAAAAVHSGWRGTVARIVEKTLLEMQSIFGTKGEDIVAGIGPSVSQDSYEVGDEVITEVRKNFSNTNDLLVHLENKKARLDLWTANKIQLLAFGVPESSIETSNLCTVKNNEYFFSARKGDTGRFAAGIILQ